MKSQQPISPKIPSYRNGLFAFSPLIPHFIIIAIVVIVYYFLTKYGLFPAWIHTIYYAVKIIIALEILAASAQTLLAPIITLIMGSLLIYGVQVYNIEILTYSDGWQLIIVALIGSLITIIRKL